MDKRIYIAIAAFLAAGLVLLVSLTLKNPRDEFLSEVEHETIEESIQRAFQFPLENVSVHFALRSTNFDLLRFVRRGELPLEGETAVLGIESECQSAAGGQPPVLYGYQAVDPEFGIGGQAEVGVDSGFRR